jgi:DNA polymerase-3 subunit chi
MPRIDFYILAEQSLRARMLLVCKLIEKAYKNRYRIYIHTQDETEAHQLDELLWTYREDSFLPHNLYGEGPDPAPPIQIGHDAIPEKHRDILINLHKTIPEFYNQFSRLLEVVVDVDNIQAIARDHFRFYKTNGHAIQTHKLQSV